jgi:hypothetical protein
LEDRVKTALVVEGRGMRDVFVLVSLIVFLLRILIRLMNTLEYPLERVISPLILENKIWSELSILYRVYAQSKFFCIKKYLKGRHYKELY